MSEKVRSFVSAQMVADRAGVSRSAVSRTFTDGASVSAATRRKVLSAANDLGYHVNHLARGLIQDRSNIVCLVVADITTPFRARMVDALTQRLQAIDNVAMLINTGSDTE
ncbi:MAG: LacI family DNA-binding transcriptional regulator, partial [Devosia sp.]|nr:LacI family DNA-binding transcriptional regulator [Devosia sp.]